MSRRAGRLAALLVAALCVPLAPPSVRAQDGTFTASVTVLLAPVTGAGMRGLEFGAVTPGAAVEVLPDAPFSGWFQLENVAKNRDLRLTFTLPVALTPAGGGEGLPVSFAGPYARTCGAGCTTHTLTPTPINASELSAEVVHVQPGPPYGSNPTTIDVYIGGRAEPLPSQPSGTYQGTIALTFAAI
jgi:hypothetical protein